MEGMHNLTCNRDKEYLELMVQFICEQFTMFRNIKKDIVIAKNECPHLSESNPWAIYIPEYYAKFTSDRDKAFAGYQDFRLGILYAQGKHKFKD